MRLKILSIDSPIIDERIIQSSFFKSSSFADYDVLIIDPHDISNVWEPNSHIVKDGDGSLWSYSLNDGGFSKSLNGIMRQRAEEVQLLLEKTGGIVVCFLRNIGTVLNYTSHEYNKGNRSIIHLYSWIPTKEFSYFYKRHNPHSNKVETVEGRCILSPSFNPYPRIGKEIGEIDKSHPFSQYFTALKSEIYFEAILNNPALFQISKPIAKNKVGEVVALEIPFGKGKFIFLPPFQKSVDTKKLTGVLLDCIRKSLEWVPSLIKPNWLIAYSLPNEERLQKKMKDAQDKLKTLLKEKEEIQKEIDEIELLKSLLYESGKYGLEPSVRKAFCILGFRVSEPEEYDKPYDLLAKEGELFIIGEIEGSKSQIDVGKYRQLLDYVTETTIDGKKCKGILIGNGYIDTEPSERPEQFTDQVIRGCDSQKYCRMTTNELYKAVNAILAEPNNQKLKDLIKEGILNCEGEFKFDTIEIATIK